jgi:hypothetical protein
VPVLLEKNVTPASSPAKPSAMAPSPMSPTCRPRSAPTIDNYNERATAFSWTKAADELLDTIKRKSINNTATAVMRRLRLSQN